MTTDYRALCAELLESAEELDDLMQGAIDGDYMPDSLTLQPIRSCLERAHTLLAQPEPVGPTDDELIRVYQAAYQPAWERGEHFGCHIDGLRAVLAHWGRPTIAPIPVSERLPGAEDCDAEGRCWFGMWSEIDGELTADWILEPPEYHDPADGRWGDQRNVAWLPFHALPLPGQPAPGAPAP
jgi:hypothetical protein